MKVLSFVEGAPANKGGVGIIGVPFALSSLAERGHNIALLVGGPGSPESEEFVVSDHQGVLMRRQGTGTFATLLFEAWPMWAFAPRMIFTANRLARWADLIHLNSLYSFPVLLGFLLARIYRKPYMIWPHGVLAPVQRKVSVRKKWLYDKLIAKRILQSASVIVYTAPGERVEAAPLYLKAPSIVVPNGVNVSAFAELPARGGFRDRFFGGYQGPLLISIARLNAKKGLDLLIQAMAEVIAHQPDVRLAIVGAPDPPAFGRQVQVWIAENSIQSSTVMTGLVTPKEKLQALADADVFVLSSQAENFGLSVFEAMASKVPVVVSNTLNYAEEIESSAAGLSVPREPKAFASAILKLLREPALCQQMGENGIRLARAYSWAATAAKIDRASQYLMHNEPLPIDLTLSA